ncbi:MAG TPA: ATP-dependent helicase, partial [Candidatus Acidoferrales bacterium]|nr:ATP-dependent helicase [Candidatus Acidoferrales bacterium]
PRDEIAFKRVAQLHPGIAAKGAQKLWKIFAAEIESFLKSQENSKEAKKDGENKASHHGGPQKNPIATALETCAPHVGKKASVAWAQFVATAAQLEEEKSPSKMLRIVIDAGYDDYLKENFANYRTRLEDLEQLAVFAYQFQTTEEFLTQLALLTNVEAEDDSAKDDDRIRLSTIHQAKGLEFDAVFVIMLCDGLFPSSRSIESAEGEEEERRLFYVAITRAKNELYLSYPLIRGGFGNSAADSMQSPSRFLGEIPKELLNEWNLRPAY